MAEKIPGETLLEECVEGRSDSTSAADHPHVSRKRLVLQDLPEAFEVVSMAPRDEEHVAPGVELPIGEGVGEVYLSDLVGFGKSFPRREVRSVVQNPDPQAEEGSQRTERLGEVASSYNDHLGRGMMELEVDRRLISSCQGERVQSLKNLGVSG